MAAALCVGASSATAATDAAVATVHAAVVSAARPPLITPEPAPMASASVVPALGKAPGPKLKALSDAQGQILLLKRQIQQTQLAIELQKARVQLQGLRRESLETQATVAASGRRGAIDVGPDAPAVTSIQGGNLTGLSADLEFPNRTVQRVGVGDAIPGGWSVSYISPGQVTLVKPGKPARILPILFRPGAKESVQTPMSAPRGDEDAAMAARIPPLPDAIDPMRKPVAETRPHAKASTQIHP